MEIAEVFAVVALLGSLVALFFSSLALRRAEIKRLRDLERMVHGLSADFVNYEDLYQRLYKSVHKLRTRAGRDDARRKQEEADDIPDPQTNPQAWAAEMQRRYPRGALDLKEQK